MTKTRREPPIPSRMRLFVSECNGAIANRCDVDTPTDPDGCCTPGDSPFWRVFIPRYHDERCVDEEGCSDDDEEAAGLLPRIPKYTEIAFFPRTEGGPYPGLYLFTSPARMMRPVLDLQTKKIELVGTLEQTYLNIACLESDIVPGVTTHREIDPTNILSIVANLTPFSDHNQSPRNMYQCQMAKQTMATPCHNFSYRTDNKMYRLLTGQSPLCRTKTMDTYDIDDYPTGVNCVVAVISYTGYDMEDAMILNKASVERGLFHGVMYTTKVIDLAEKSKANASSECVRFSNRKIDASGLKSDASALVNPGLDADGLPEVGTRLEMGSPMYCTYNPVTREHHVTLYRSTEPCVIDAVRLLPSSSASSASSSSSRGSRGMDMSHMMMMGGGGMSEGLGIGGPVLTKVSLKLRYQRIPVIGDKFSSRHGQKGTLSQLWPQENMPFSESGMTPDVIINPHAFPSRMTIGMLIESMAGKVSSIDGGFEDATPFGVDAEHSEEGPVEWYGKRLRSLGFQHYGSEMLYSGTLGCEMQAEIFMGLVFYQRLRHMVKDKFQVRSKGTVNRLTHQPIKGRKLGGGIRFGEMERDSLLSHEVSFLLQDRLFGASDEHEAFICSSCGSILSSFAVRPETETQHSRSGVGMRAVYASGSGQQVMCRVCHKTDSIQKVSIPYVFVFLANELAGMNIRLKLGLGPAV